MPRLTFLAALFLPLLRAQQKNCPPHIPRKDVLNVLVQRNGVQDGSYVRMHICSICGSIYDPPTTVRIY